MDNDHILLMKYENIILTVGQILSRVAIFMIRFVATILFVLLAVKVIIGVSIAYAEPPISVGSYEEMLAYNAAVKANGGGPRDYIYSICQNYMIINDAPSMYGFHANPDKRYYTNGRCGANDQVTVTYGDK